MRHTPMTFTLRRGAVPELPRIPERTDPMTARLVLADANRAHGTSYSIEQGGT